MSNRVAGFSSLKPFVRLQRERLLPLPSEVLVSAGEEVEPATVIAQAEVAQRPFLLPVARALSLPDEELPLFVLKKVGEEVVRGEVLARKKRGLPWGREYLSPAAGRVVAQSRGRVLLDLAPSPTKLVAGLAGVVLEIIPERGAVIEATAAVVEGLWGNGGETFGVMKVVSEAEGGALLPEHFDSRFSDSIVVGTGWAEKETLAKAAEVGVRGMILGSIPASILDNSSGISYPLMLTEGFGKLVMARPIANLLERLTWQEAYLVAIGPRPRVIVPLERPEVPIAEKTIPLSVEKGQQVRLGGGEKIGQVGLVANPSPRWQRLESGLFARCVEVVLDSEDRVWVPLANIEVLG